MKKFVILLCSLAVFIGSITGVQILRKQKAVSLAQKYITQKYEDIEFTYVDSEYRKVDPSQYYVYFSVTDPSIKICVRVQSDLKVDEDKCDDKVIIVADNYFQECFRMKAKSYYNSIFLPLSNIRTINLYVINNALYGYEYSADVSLDDDLATLLNTMDYVLVVNLIDSDEESVKKSLKEINDILDECGLLPSGIELRNEGHVVYYQDNPRKK